MTTDRQAHLSTRFLSLRAWAVAEATALALVIWSLATLVGVEFTVESGGSTQQIGVAAVVFVPLVTGLAGWATLALLERRVTQPRRVWTVIASTVLLLSLLGPLLEGIGAATTVTLVALHLGVGSVLITQLPRRA